MVKVEKQPETQETPSNLRLRLKAFFVRVIVVCIVAGGGYVLYKNPLFVERFTKHFENDASLSAQIAELQNQVTFLQQQIDEQRLPDISVFDDKFSAMEKYNMNVIDSKADAGIVLGMLTRVDKLENRLDKLAKVSDDSALILMAAMMVRQSAEEGHGFIYEAEILNQLAENALPIKKDVSVISEFSRNGVVSKSDLIKSFDTIFSTVHAKQQPTEDADWKERLNSKLGEYIKISKVDEKKAEEDKNQSELALISEQLKAGKVAKAVLLLKKTNAEELKNNDALREWLADAQNYLNFNQAVRNIAAFCLADMKVNNLRNKD